MSNDLKYTTIPPWKTREEIIKARLREKLTESEIQYLEEKSDKFQVDAFKKGFKDGFLKGAASVFIIALIITGFQYLIEIIGRGNV